MCVGGLGGRRAGVCVCVYGGPPPPPPRSGLCPLVRSVRRWRGVTLGPETCPLQALPPQSRAKLSAGPWPVSPPLVQGSAFALSAESSADTVCVDGAYQSAHSLPRPAGVPAPGMFSGAPLLCCRVVGGFDTLTAMENVESDPKTDRPKVCAPEQRSSLWARSWVGACSRPPPLPGGDPH